MTTETPSRVDRLLSLFETSLISLANEFAEKVDAEHVAATHACDRQDWEAAQHHQSRAKAFIEACALVNLRIMTINNEVLK